jgi:hypothetical protein
MRGLAGALVVAATAALGVPVAAAGTYDVVSCGAPGAGGINRAWRAEASGYPPSGISPDPSSYVIADQCGSQLLIQTAPPPANAPFLTGGNWIFDAPAGTRITRLETWRFGVKLRTGSTNPEGDTWKIFARDENASVIGGVFGETCTAAEGSIGCSFGSDTGVSEASHAVYPVNVARISYSISCEYTGGCPRYFDDGTNRAPVATIKLFGSRVTVNDPTAPALKTGGPLLSGGWRKPGDVLTYDASDNSGIRSVRLDMAGRSRRDSVACDYHLTAPCAARGLGTLSAPAGTPDGAYSAHIVAEDAAGNPTSLLRTIRVDGTPPGAVIERTRGRTIVLSLTDNAAGVADATLEVRRSSSDPYRTLNATINNGRLTAKLDSGKASKVDMRVTVRDNAGNVARGNPTRLTATGAKVGRHVRKVRSGRVKVPFGRKATLRGRLTLSAGQSFAGQTITATSAVRKGGAKPEPAGTATTNRHGRFSLEVPAGPSRTYRLVFAGSGGALGGARGVSVRVPASSTIHASRTHLSSGRVRFSGRLRTRGQRVPGRGLVLVLQGRERGKWRTFEDTRTNGKGSWHVSYTFSGRPGRYPIRVRIRRQSGYPFELGYSRALAVRVG